MRANLLIVTFATIAMTLVAGCKPTGGNAERCEASPQVVGNRLTIGDVVLPIESDQARIFRQECTDGWYIEFQNFDENADARRKLFYLSNPGKTALISIRPRKDSVDHRVMLHGQEVVMLADGRKSLMTCKVMPHPQADTRVGSCHISIDYSQDTRISGNFDLRSTERSSWISASNALVNAVDQLKKNSALVEK